MAGSLRQRGRSSWELRVHAGRDELTGRKLYVTKTVRGGRREAERELARLVASVDDGAKVVKAGTVAELCEKWFEITAPELSPAVAAEYRRLLDQRILFAGAQPVSAGYGPPISTSGTPSCADRDERADCHWRPTASVASTACCDER